MDVASIEFINNQPCVDLIEKGILPKLDDMNMSTWETTDAQFLDQIVRQFTSNDYFGKSKLKQVDRFSIHHFAGEVTYTVDGFLEKNNDTLFTDLEVGHAPCCFCLFPLGCHAPFCFAPSAGLVSARAGVFVCATVVGATTPLRWMHVRLTRVVLLLLGRASCTAARFPSSRSCFRSRPWQSVVLMRRRPVLATVPRASPPRPRYCPLLMVSTRCCCRAPCGEPLVITPTLWSSITGMG